MAGLVSGSLQRRIEPGALVPGHGPHPAAGPAESVPDEEGEAASPEEQADYEALVTEALEAIYEGGKVRPSILELLDEDPRDLKRIFGEALPLDKPADPARPDGPTMWQAQGPVIALAATGVALMLEALRRLGRQPEGHVILHAGKAIVEELGEVAESAGRRDYSPDELGEALRKGADLFREAAGAAGMIDMKAVREEFGEIVAADKAGRLGEVVPGLREAGERRPRPGRRRKLRGKSR
jgi:hypothetical protein